MNYEEWVFLFMMTFSATLAILLLNAFTGGGWYLACGVAGLYFCISFTGYLRTYNEYHFEPR